jgi:alkanesulfonate monooxygenase SsuD/methylene tetrahydromethanopterin reductase-like flavin-dependent oxidoreductase (luciferase family)
VKALGARRLASARAPPEGGTYDAAMRTGVFLFGGVELRDAGAGLPAPTDRRSTQTEMWRATEQLLDLGIECERLGYDIFWLTEHHFQHEGYEVVPNGILFGTTLAARTSRIGIGTMFNIVPQWHPLRLAEDFSYLHNL